ncbi:MAG: tellurite resistance TerB family protein [Sulfuricaulis sp.]
MLQNLKQFFDQHILSNGAAPGAGAQRALQVATAALLVEAMRTNGEIKEVERQAVTAVLQKHFSMTPAETETLLRVAQAEAEKATDYYRFTALINEHFSAQQKEQVVEYLWQVAAADHNIDRLERTFVYKIADLLYVPRVAQFAARERALSAGG